MSFTSKTDDEIIKLANPIWLNLIKSSNMKDYGGFTRDFSSQMLYGANEVELGKQWASNKLISSLTDNFKAFGCLRRGMHVTVLFKQTSTTEEGEFLGRLVLGEEGGVGHPRSARFAHHGQRRLRQSTDLLEEFGGILTCSAPAML